MDRLVVRVDRLVIGAVDFGPVPVRIQNIQKEGVRDAVPAWATLDAVDIACGRHDIQKIDDVHRRRHPESDMVEPRPDPVGKGDVVDAALAVHPGSP